MAVPLSATQRISILLAVSYCCFCATAFPVVSPPSTRFSPLRLPIFYSARHASRAPSQSVDDDDDDFFNFWDEEEDEPDSDGDGKYSSENIPHVDNRASLAAATQTDNSHFFSSKSLTDFSTPNQKLFLDLCKGAGITRPSKIQSLAWPALLKGKTTILADQTGSGKTLAYLIPLILRILDPSNTSETKTPKKPYSSPRLIVLTPTAELADQTRAVCDKLAVHVPQLKTLVLSATGNYATNIRDQIRLLQRQSFSVLISTPGRLATILRTNKSGGLDLSQLQSIVLDEVDVLLLDDTFGPQLRTLSAAAPVAQTQFVFCTATLPNTVQETVQREFPHVKTITGPGLHRIAPTVKERLVDVSVSAKDNRDAKLCFDIKAKELIKALRQVRCRRTLVFCNTVEHCRQVENLLKRRGNRQQQLYQVYSYHSAMTAEARNANLASFSSSMHSSTGSSNNSTKSTHTTTNARNNNDDAILVCTDRAARGVDFRESPVDHVVLFDFPKDPAEYVRRVGRTARAGRPGHSTVFAYGWQLPVAKSVMLGAKLDNFSVGVPQNNDEENDAQEYMGGVKGRRQQKKKQKDYSITENIKSGILWS